MYKFIGYTLIAISACIASTIGLKALLMAVILVIGFACLVIDTIEE